MEKMTTEILHNELSQCKYDEELQAYLKNYEEFRINWKDYINEQLMITGLSYKKFGDRCGFSKNTIKSWCEEGVVPRNRDQYIKLGFGLGMNEQEVNHLLTAYGGYQALYSKDIHDAICIFFLKKQEQNAGEVCYGYEIVKSWHKQYATCVGNHAISMQYYKEVATKDLTKEIAMKKREKEFLEYVECNRDVFSHVYSRLIIFMEDCIQIRIKECMEDSVRKVSVHQLFQRKHLDGSFEVAFSKLKRHGIVPTRQQLIQFAIAMNMTRNEIDYMLGLANMSPLCVRNRAECILLYLLQQFENKHPGVELENAFKMERITRSPEIRNQFQKVIRHFYDEDDVEYEEDELDNELAIFVEDGMKRLLG